MMTGAARSAAISSSGAGRSKRADHPQNGKLWFVSEPLLPWPGPGIEQRQQEPHGVGHLLLAALAIKGPSVDAVRSPPRALPPVGCHPAQPVPHQRRLPHAPEGDDGRHMGPLGPAGVEPGDVPLAPE